MHKVNKCKDKCSERSTVKTFFHIEWLSPSQWSHSIPLPHPADSLATSVLLHVQLEKTDCVHLQTSKPAVHGASAWDGTFEVPASEVQFVMCFEGLVTFHPPQSQSSDPPPPHIYSRLWTPSRLNRVGFLRNLQMVPLILTLSWKLWL